MNLDGVRKKTYDYMTSKYPNEPIWWRLRANLRNEKGNKSGANSDLKRYYELLYKSYIGNAQGADV